MVEFSADFSDTHSDTSTRYESMSQNIGEDTHMPTVANPPNMAASSQNIVERTRPKARMQKPEPYDDTDRTRFPQFIAFLEAKLLIDQNVWDTDVERVWYAFGCLTGKAATRILPWMTTYSTSPEQFTTKKFFSHLKTSFEDKATKTKAMSKLSYMKQGQREFGEHLSEFEQTLLEAGVSDYDDGVKINWLRMSLSSDLRGSSVSVDEDIGYSEYCQRLRKIAYRMEENDRLNKRTRNGANPWLNPGRPMNPRNQPINAAVDRGDPMDIDSGNRTTYNVRTAKWVDKSVLEARRNSGQCMRCGGSDHLIRACPYGAPKRPGAKINNVSQPLLESEDEGTDQEGKE
ncbi:hypothetical protein ACJ73_08578 [Blastomyces percursus]|uniref:CCHC-type domain-containing protein n=1 Tax=Blastomyces percursus TaxID=1658174 RepID=A0A1J9PW08_9EURO|nr:hypothetical protein ACJ73_08578 [Blastomyces percursus]